MYLWEFYDPLFRDTTLNDIAAVLSIYAADDIWAALCCHWSRDPRVVTEPWWASASRPHVAVVCSATDLCSANCA